MRNLVVSSVVLLCLGAQPSGAQASAPLDAEIASLRLADSSWNAASISRSVDRMMAFYAPHATSDLGSAPARGHDAIRRLWTQAYADASYLLSWKTTRIEPMAGTDLAYALGVWTLQQTSGTRTGTYFAVWQRQPDGRWLVLIDAAR